MAAYHALLGFTGWTLFLVALVFGYRGFRLLTGTPINSWSRGAKSVDDPVLMKRVEDAHANALENLPIFAVLVLSAAAMGKLDAINALAPYVLYARVGQSLVHLSGTNQLQVLIRATFWSVQLGLFFLMLVKLFA
ncbi:MAG: MAPEG family protein [Nevskiaceae bacterium]|nr:MAG: MAPEG family protein [Nevskiaceae bacterium]TAM22930.1 MAG: MAPEG family protein [Nevskiaceae bacterium]